MPVCHWGQRTRPTPKVGTFLGIPSRDRNIWKGIPPHLLWIEFWKPSHDHIAWATCRVLSRTASSRLSALVSYLVNLFELFFFSHIKAMVRCSGKGSWEMWIPRAGPGTDSWGQLHIWETSLWICYVSYTSPDVLCLEETDRPCWDSGEYLANGFLVWRPCYY